VLVAALLAIMYLLHGGPGAQFGALMTDYGKDPIKANVGDEARRDRALEALKVADREVDALNHQVAMDVQQFERLVKDYGSTPETFDALLEKSSTRHREQVDRIWEARAALLRQVTAEEWGRIVAGAQAKKAAKDRE
jgi:hypothetical protein